MRQHTLSLERLELRTLLSAASGEMPVVPSYAAGEMIVGFAGPLTTIFEYYGEQTTLELAQRLVNAAGLHAGSVVHDLPTCAGQPARLATRWQLAESADLQAVARQLTELPGVAYAEPNYILTRQSIPGDASFVGDWEFGLQEHLTQIDAPAAWDVTTGDASVVVAVIDTGVDLDHPDLNDNLLPGTTFVEGTTTAQDDNGHGTQIAGLIAAEMDNLADLASEANGDTTWAGGVVGVAPHVNVLPVKVLNHAGYGLISDIAAGIDYAVDPDGDPGTDDGADVIVLSLGGEESSQLVADAIAQAHDRGVLVITAASPGYSFPAMDPYALAVTAVNANDVWDGINGTGSHVDIAAPGVDVLTTFVDVDDPAEAIAVGGAYGRVSGSSMSTPIVAATAALIKSLHPDWGPDEIAGQLLATAASISAVNTAELQGQLGAGASTSPRPLVRRRIPASARWSAWAIRRSTLPSCRSSTWAT